MSNIQSIASLKNTEKAEIGLMRETRLGSSLLLFLLASLTQAAKSDLELLILLPQHP